MYIETYDFSQSELVAAYNTIKDRIFERLAADGVIESAENMSLTYVVELVGRGRFGAWWDRVFKIEKGKYQIHILKIDHGSVIDWDKATPKAKD